MPSVRSTAVERCDYSAKQRRLTVTFTSGAVYGYDGVAPETYEALLGAPSVGTFVNRAIKPNYPATRIIGPPANAR